jgi:hypothetical protein
MVPRPLQRDPDAAMADRRPAGARPSGRGRPDDPLMQEVRWRLFRREDLPARLRRLERLEDAAFADRSGERTPNGDGADTAG